MRSCLAGMALLFAACGGGEAASTPEFLPPVRTPPDAGSDAGCTADLQNDPTSCGACNVVCPSGPNQKASCAAGSCKAVCAAGFDDCDGDLANGCEKAVTDDPTSCGACGRTCATCGAAACSNGACAPTRLVTGQTGAAAIALDATRVYWANRVSGGKARRASKADGSAVEDVATGDFITDIVATGTYLYYTRPTSAPTGEGVARVSMPGIFGPFPPFVTGQDSPGGMTSDDTGIYWTRNQGLSGTLVRCFGCNASALDLVGNLPPSGRIALDAESIVAVLGDAVVSFDKTGANKVVLAISQQALTGMVSDGKNVFVAKTIGLGGGAPGAILRIPKTPGTASTLVPAITPASLALDGSVLYFSVTSPDASLRRIDASGAREVTLARGLTAPGAVVTDAQCAYFVDGDNISRVTK